MFENPYGFGVKKHLHNAPIQQRIPSKRYKLYWSRSTASSASSGTIRVKPSRPQQKLYIVVGNGGDNSNFAGGGAIPSPTHVGHDSGVGTSADYGSNLIIAPAGIASAAGTRYKSGVVGAPPALCYAGTQGEAVDLTKWSATTWIRNVQGNRGNWYAIYDSWHTPGSARTVSSLDNLASGPGASGYNDYKQDYASYPALGGYVKITIVK